MERLARPAIGDARMSTPVPLRRKWLCFSLRTLLLIVLLIGSSATLWWNWGTFSCKVEGGYAAYHAEFSDDGTLLLLLYESLQTQEVERLEAVDIETGQRRAVISNIPSNGGYQIRGDYAYFDAKNGRNPRSHLCAMRQNT